MTLIFAKYVNLISLLSMIIPVKISDVFVNTALQLWRCTSFKGQDDYMLLARCNKPVNFPLVLHILFSRFYCVDFFVFLFLFYVIREFNSRSLLTGRENHSSKGCTDKTQRFSKSTFSQRAGSNSKNLARLSSIYFQSVLRQRCFITVLYSSMAATLYLNLHESIES